MCGGNSSRVRSVYREATWPQPAPRVTANSLVCPNCGDPVQPDFILCPSCGTSLKRSCPACHKAVNVDWVVCPYCGTDLGKSSRRATRR